MVDPCQNTAIGCGNWLVSTSGSEPQPRGQSRRIWWAFARIWSLKAEYMLIALDNQNIQTSGPVTTTSRAPSWRADRLLQPTFDDIHTAKIGLNYRFY